MEKECFEDAEVAEVLNRHFVPIKVDREERPDVDHIYMTFCQMLTGHGGWPLTIFMTAEQKPFYAGTYFPKKGRGRMPGLLDILDRVCEAWDTNRDSLIHAGNEFEKSIGEEMEVEGSAEEVSKDTLDTAFNIFKRAFEPQYGGFSTAPKFPSPHNLSFLLRYWRVTGEREALDMVEKTLEGMYRGGIFDHIGMGFSRYSVDKQWLVPHFEKMLYDNALLAIAYIEAFQATHKSVYADIAKKIFSYVLRDMTSPGGGFYAAEDADSEGVEGKFYVWSPDEVIGVLGEEAGKSFCEYYGITGRGNFEGKNIPNRIHAKGPVDEEEDKTAPLRKQLFEHREKRVHPFKDDKILTGWNGMMIASLALGGRVLEEEVYTKAAQRAAKFVEENLFREDGRLLSRYRDGEAANPGYADDYAFYIWGLIELYQTTYDPDYLLKALSLNDEMLIHFWDKEKGGFFMYGSEDEQLISRPKEIYDGAVPSGNSVAAMNLIRLARLTGDRELEAMADSQLKTFANTVNQSPYSYTHFLMAAMFNLFPSAEVVIAGNRKSKDTKEMMKALHTGFAPQVVSLLYPEGEDMSRLMAAVPFLKEQTSLGGKATAYVCQNYACQSPITSVEMFKAALYNSETKKTPT